MKILFSVVIILLTACNNDKAQDLKLVRQGYDLFQTNCANCHGKNAEGETKNWRKTLPDGTYPAPPLNGTAHAWHHSPAILKDTIINGGKKSGGRMPGFAKVLNDQEITAILAYIYNIWPKKIQDSYKQRFK